MKINQRNMQGKNGSGHYGDWFEGELKGVFGFEKFVSRGRSWDLVLNRKRYELKTGAGELGCMDKKPLYGSSMVIYCPVVQQEFGIEKQEAFVISKKAFLEVIQEVGLMRIGKTTTNGGKRYAIQTFYNKSKNKPHSIKKYDALIDALYANMEMTLDEFIKMNKEG